VFLALDTDEQAGHDVVTAKLRLSFMLIPCAVIEGWQAPAPDGDGTDREGASFTIVIAMSPCGDIVSARRSSKGCDGMDSSSSGYARPASLVGTAWVAEHMGDSNVRLVEVDVDTTAYETGHIPGAVGWNWQVDLQRRPVRDIPSKEEWEALLARSGIGNDTTVVLYGDNNNWFAAFALWLFELYGHQDVKLMNGSRSKWLAEGRETTSEIPRPQPAHYTAREPNLALRAYRGDVAETIGQADRGLVDVRSPQEYAGELLAPANLPQEGAQRGGHVPGAQNIPWATAVNEDGTFKAADDLHALYGGKGITADKPTIAYCRIGERSAHTWFVLSHLLGYPNVRNYDGSWTEWGSLIGAPIEV
jgi:thiosulfate/3-mercaptopyruvate sulfurtransferase